MKCNKYSFKCKAELTIRKEKPLGPQKGQGAKSYSNKVKVEGQGLYAHVETEDCALGGDI